MALYEVTFFFSILHLFRYIMLKPCKHVTTLEDSSIKCHSVNKSMAVRKAKDWLRRKSLFISSLQLFRHIMNIEHLQTCDYLEDRTRLHWRKVQVNAVYLTKAWQSKKVKIAFVRSHFFHSLAWLKKEGFSSSLAHLSKWPN